MTKKKDAGVDMFVPNFLGFCEYQRYASVLLWSVKPLSTLGVATGLCEQ